MGMVTNFYEAKSPSVGPGTYFLEWHWGSIYLINIYYYPMIEWDQLFKQKSNWAKVAHYGYFEGNSMEDVRFIPMSNKTPVPVPNDGITWDKLAKSCSCGGKIDSHKSDCPESKDFNYQSPFYYIDYIGPNGPSKSMSEPVKKCECGSESVGSQKHSNWCPKFVKE